MKFIFSVCIKFYNYLKFNKYFGYDDYEKKFLNFLKKNNESINTSKKIVLINAYQDYYSLVFSFLLRKEKMFENYKFIFYLPLVNFHKIDHSTHPIKFFFKFHEMLLRDYLINVGWMRFYRLISPNFFTWTNKIFFKEFSYLLKAKKILKKIKNKKQLINFKYKNILIGDLVYDTYLRFTSKPTINLEDKFLISILSKALYQYNCLQEFSKKNKVIFYFTHQSSYINHGMPSRFFLNNGTRVFSFDTRVDYFREENKKNIYFKKSYKLYPKIFLKLKNKQDKLKQAEKLLRFKFKGGIIKQEKWMPLSVYHNNPLKIKNKILGVVFLHCFLDSPLSWGKIIFNDFEEWITLTLNFFKKYNIEKNILIKPHPNSKKESRLFENYLKGKYSDFVWVDRNCSNKKIFEKKPKFGISVYGTVLHEMAYHGILPVAAGDNPCQAYDFVKTARSQKEYFNFIKNAIRSKKIYYPNKKKILEMAYCNYINDETNLDLIAKKFKLKDFINPLKSSSLLKFLNVYNNN